MVCSHVRGDNPRALANGLSPEQVDKPWSDCFIPATCTAHYEIFHAKAGKSGMILVLS